MTTTQSAASPLEDADQATDPGARAGAPRVEEPIRVLLIEDRAAEAELTVRQLHGSGLSFTPRRVWTEQSLREAILEFRPAVVLSDFTLPGFDGMTALQIVREMAPEVPFVFVSGTIGEERAIEALRCGAVDYVLKSNLKRLGPAVNRALDDARARRERQRQQTQIAHLTRVLRLLSGVNGAVVRIRDRKELFSEACRLAVGVGSYAAALVAVLEPASHAIQTAACNGIDPQAADALAGLVSESLSHASSVIRQVLHGSRTFVCNDTSDLHVTDDAKALMAAAGFRSGVVLPLQLDQTTIGVFVLCSREAGSVSDEELKMLQEVAANLSFALQYLQRDDAVQFLAYFDPLTGLAKRSLFCERLQRRLRHADGLLSHAVAVVDIEQLSVINDSIGRHMGDRLLQLVAERLRNTRPDTECLAHLGGGTFAVVLDVAPVEGQSGGWSDASAVLAELLNPVFVDPFELEGRRLPITVKSGVAVYPEDGKDADTLMQNAEAALRDARANGERHQHYSTRQRTELVARLELEHKLRTAIALRQFELYYQPKVDAGTLKANGVEALIRWRHPESGLISPAAFLPLLESSGLIVQAGDWVVEQAAKDCRQWQCSKLPSGRVAVNISPAELRRPGFTQRFLSLTEAWADRQWGLDIEITEGALVGDNSLEIEGLRRLRAAGVRIAIDDFGTGYSSLSRLSDLPIDTLKIDRTFITRLPHDVAGRTLVATIITLAHAFGMTVVAEGVESSEQLAELRELGCDQIQGFLISKPLPADALVGWLERGGGMPGASPSAV